MNKLLIPNTCQVPNVLLDKIIPSLPVAMPELLRGLPSRSDKRSDSAITDALKGTAATQMTDQDLDE